MKWLWRALPLLLHPLLKRGTFCCWREIGQKRHSSVGKELIMGKLKEVRSLESRESLDKHEEAKEKSSSMFERLFSPQETEDDSSASSASDEHSEGSHSNQSTISGSSVESDGSSCSSIQSIQRFDRELRAKHRSACKNMTVSAPMLIMIAYPSHPLTARHGYRMANIPKPSKHSREFWQICWIGMERSITV